MTLRQVGPWPAQGGGRPRQRPVWAFALGLGLAACTPSKIPPVVGGGAVRASGVVRASGGEALTGARVCAWPTPVGIHDQGWRPTCANTDNEGRYQLTLMPGATVHLIADAVGYLPGEYRDHPIPARPWLTVPLGAPPSDLDITLEPGGVWLRGQVIDPDGHPVANASIALIGHADQPWQLPVQRDMIDKDPVRNVEHFLFIWKWERSIQATTDVDGRYEVWGEAGSSVFAMTDGWALFAQHTVETMGGTLVKLIPEAVIRGRIFTERGEGVPGVRVSTHAFFDEMGNPYYALHSDASGYFEIRGLAENRYRVVALTPELMETSEEFPLDAGATSPMVPIHLSTRVAPLRGHVVGLDTGEAVPFCHIGLIRAAKDEASIFDLDGLGRLDVVLPPDTYSFEFMNCPGWAGRPPYPQFKVGDNSAPRWELDRGSTLRGQLVAANGEPIAGRWLSLDHEERSVDRFLSEQWVPSDADGAFEFHGLRPGRYRMHAGLDWTHPAPEVEVGDGVTTTTLRLPPMGALEVRAPGDDGWFDLYSCPPPPGGWRVDSPGQSSRKAVSGLAKFDGIAPGRYRLSRSMRRGCSGDPGEIEVVVVADETTTVTLPVAGRRSSRG